MWQVVEEEGREGRERKEGALASTRTRENVSPQMNPAWQHVDAPASSLSRAQEEAAEAASSATQRHLRHSEVGLWLANGAM